MDAADRKDPQRALAELECMLRDAVFATNVDLAPTGLSLSLTPRRFQAGRAEGYIVKCEGLPHTDDHYALVEVTPQGLGSRVLDRLADDESGAETITEPTPERLYDRMASLAEALAGLAM